MIHPKIQAEFLGVLMDASDEERNLGLDDQVETEGEQIRRVL